VADEAKLAPAVNSKEKMDNFATILIIHSLNSVSFILIQPSYINYMAIFTYL
jgi:hypothetical protein